MPSNITTIEHTYEMTRFGAYKVIPLECESDAAYYAAGRQAYFYRSQILGMWLLVPVLEG